MPDLRYATGVKFLNLLRNEYMVVARKSKKQDKRLSVTEHCSFQMLLSSISCLKPASMKMSEALTEDTFTPRTSQFLTGGSTLLPCGQWRKGEICNNHWLEPRYPCWLSTFYDYCQWLFQTFAGSRGAKI